jgi:hypothetical protein
MFANNQLTSAVIGNSVSVIGVDTFYNNNLASVTIGNSVILIRANAFARNQLHTITIPDNVKTIEENAFDSNQITRVTIGANVRLGSSSNSSGLSFNFDNFYKRNGSKAGTYIYSRGEWSME